MLKVIDVESVSDLPVPKLTDDDHAVLHEMAEELADVTKAKVSRRKVKEVFHDLTFDKERAQQLFASGVLSLRERALAEQMYHATIGVITRIVMHDRDEYEDIVADLDSVLVDRYFCNFSLFQSLPDSWAIDQLFPIMPIHRLKEEPTRRGTLQDITCDSDGKIDRFVGEKGGDPSLALHEWRGGHPHMLGGLLPRPHSQVLSELPHPVRGTKN